MGRCRGPRPSTDPHGPTGLCPPDAERTEVGRFAKNFLPILFNVYSQPGDDGRNSAHRRAMLDTVRTYLAVTEQQVRGSAGRPVSAFVGREGRTWCHRICTALGWDCCGSRAEPWGGEHGCNTA